MFTITTDINNLLINTYNFLFSPNFLVGFIVGIFICFILIMKLKNFNLVKFIKKNATFNTLIFFSISIVAFILFISGLLGIKIENDVLNTILNSFVSFVFAFMLSEYSNEKNFKEKQKEPAIRSYRHSMNILSKIDCGIETIKLVELDFKYCKSNNVNGCNFISNIHRIKDLMNTLRMDCVENINDWADILSDDIEKINKIDALKSKIIYYKSRYIQNENVEDREIHINALEEISNIENQITTLEESIDSRLKNTISIRDKYEDTYRKDIQDEIKKKEADLIKRDIKLDSLKSKLEKLKSNPINVVEKANPDV